MQCSSSASIKKTKKPQKLASPRNNQQIQVQNREIKTMQMQKNQEKTPKMAASMMSIYHQHPLLALGSGNHPPTLGRQLLLHQRLLHQRLLLLNNPPQPTPQLRKLPHHILPLPLILPPLNHRHPHLSIPPRLLRRLDPLRHAPPNRPTPLQLDALSRPLLLLHQPLNGNPQVRRKQEYILVLHVDNVALALVGVCYVLLDQAQAVPLVLPGRAHSQQVEVCLEGADDGDAVGVAGFVPAERGKAGAGEAAVEGWGAGWAGEWGGGSTCGGTCVGTGGGGGAVGGDLGGRGGAWGVDLAAVAVAHGAELDGDGGPAVIFGLWGLLLSLGFVLLVLGGFWLGSCLWGRLGSWGGRHDYNWGPDYNWGWPGSRLDERLRGRKLASHDWEGLAPGLWWGGGDGLLDGHSCGR
ncbi:hypothetical protein BJ508DRAFT_59393 [Ascobolus immersus RN42]|uniref:Uncharacterized protein n=1 Tax=Ascobolus immersus RN42 TaxID=1160509 RepID=A0A3N4IPQ5_ASCIM|nr:hypothetical protein BJ508DRAFT_59393 [Ascobolus immersus RN42]